ncbi:hypothetical protein PROH_02485 [Prochlorothrix hollandica PCC 9006 = CALU 1027]|uniref:SWIM-type domain-containing protein n=2 Tax=Prochlorothrix hollandica TaxID=1223 RepID=A0A0M2PXU0_PROHO|nr:hypothetical protein PROH_02485 [Prochlorothrix hollandica PCC 9006 = CALU 1027]
MSHLTTIYLSRSGMIGLSCNCSRKSRGWCAHQVALGLFYHHHPQHILPIKDLPQLLQPLKQHQLVNLVRFLVAQMPKLMELVETWLYLHDPDLIDPDPDRSPPTPVRLESDSQQALAPNLDHQADQPVSQENPNVLPPLEPDAHLWSDLCQNSAAASIPASIGSDTPASPLDLRQQRQLVLTMIRRTLASRFTDYEADYEIDYEADYELDNIDEFDRSAREERQDFVDLLETTIFPPIRARLESGEPRVALGLLEVSTDICATLWQQILVAAGEAAVTSLDCLWAEVLLSVRFQPREEMEWQLKLDDWQIDFNDIILERSGEVLRQGWDDPALVRILAGQPADLWPDGRPDYGHDVIAARLRVLERQGQWDAHLALATAEQCWLEGLIGLVKQNRIQQVLAKSVQLRSPKDLLTLAQTLDQVGHGEVGIQVARIALTLVYGEVSQTDPLVLVGLASVPQADEGDRGLVNPGAVNPGVVNPGVVNPGVVNPGAVNPGAIATNLTTNLATNLDPNNPTQTRAPMAINTTVSLVPMLLNSTATVGTTTVHHLALWLGKAALAWDYPTVALEAHVAALGLQPTLALYEAAEALAGEQWPDLQPQLMPLIDTAWPEAAPGKVAIFVKAEEWDRVIAVIDRGFTSALNLEPIVDALVPHRPRWVIDRGKQWALDIINRSRSAEYGTAVRWLERVYKAHQVDQSLEQWTTFQQNLHQQHGRKQKLMQLLKTSASPLSSS